MPRRKPFSGKQKKAQLLNKRERKRPSSPVLDQEPSAVGPVAAPGVLKVHEQPASGRAGASGGYDPNRYRLHFEREPTEQVEKRKLAAKREILVPLSQDCLEVCVDDVYKPGSVLDIPKRPPWSYNMTKQQVEGQEEVMFRHYLESIYSQHKPDQLSYFEHNLETWRQLWRVLEVSDIVLLIADIRHPALHFSPALYKFVVEELKKTLVLILNKVDLVRESVTLAWVDYFKTKFPHVQVITFSCHPIRDRKRSSRLQTPIGSQELLTAIQRICKVDLGLALPTEEVTTQTMTSDPLERDAVASGVMTVGLVGHPNVGKSSIINGLLGHKVVSTSRTPGHTKHFQTIFLTKLLRLCDCPGLVFPSLVERQLQVLSGVYPIAQVREPYTAVGYAAQRIPLIQHLSLQHPSLDGKLQKKARHVTNEPGHVTEELAHVMISQKWTAWEVCDAWAEKRRYYTARGARLDTYRAANCLLRMLVDGKLCLSHLPPGYIKNRDHWEGEDGMRDGGDQAIPVLSEDMASEPSSSSESGEDVNFDNDLTTNKFSQLLNLPDSS